MSEGQITVEEGASPELMARVKSFAAAEAETENSNITMIPNPDAEVPAIPEVDIDLSKEDDPAPAEEPKGEQKAEELKDDPKAEPTETDETDETDTQTVKVTFRGKERELTPNDISAALGRADASQKKADKLQGSEEYKMGLLMTAAKGGDKSAQKKLQKLLVEYTGVETPDDMIDNLEEVDGDFDEESVLQKKEEELAFDDAFSDVEGGVDFQKNMDIVSTDLKGRMPAKVFDAYWAKPDTRRTMYDLVALGRLDELMDAFDQNLAKLPFREQLYLEKDPDEWGELFAKTVREQNASRAKAPTGQGQSDSNTDAGSTTEGKSAEDSVSRGTRGRSPQNAQSSEETDFFKMTPQQFAAWKRERGLPT